MSTRTDPSQFLRKASDIASFYGFRHSLALKSVLPRQHKLSAAGSRDFDSVAQACVNCLSEKIPVVVPLVPQKAHTPLPPVYAKDAMLYFHVNPTPTDVPRGVLAKEVAEFGVSIVGSQGSIGEIVALKTLMSILTETGTIVRGVRVGSAGDRDSQIRYARELGVYMKKHAGDIGECCREASASDPLVVVKCESEGCVHLVHEGPRAMNYLSEKSRGHFREVLEYLERTEMPYELDERLIHDERQPRVSFALDLENTDGLIVSAHGGRFDDHIRKLTGKKDATSVRASVFFRKKGAVKSDLNLSAKERQAKIYFIKLGIEATLKSLTVLDSLRRARIPVYQSFAADKLGPQMLEAERLKVPYLLIMGQREAMQDAIIVRRVETRSQHIVTLRDLPEFLRTV